MTSISYVHPDPRMNNIIAGTGEVYITVDSSRLSATIRRSPNHEVYATVTSAEEARAVLTRGANEYEIYIGVSDVMAANIAEMVSAVRRALVTVTA